MKRISARMKVHTAARTVIEVVAEAFYITPEDLVSSQQTARVLIPRHVAAWMLYRRLPLSMEAVGLILGARHHSTVINAIKRVEGWISVGSDEGRVAADLDALLFPGASGRAVGFAGNELTQVMGAREIRPASVHGPACDRTLHLFDD